MTTFRLLILFLGLSVSLRRTSGFASKQISVSPMTRDLGSLHMSASGTNDLVSQSTSQEQQHKQNYPSAAVSVALRCFCGDEAHYLLIRRGNEPNKGKWALPGGKLEWGEKSIKGAKRELSEEVLFDSEQPEIVWSPEPYAVADAIAEGFHYLIAVCFAECKLPHGEKPPKVLAADDATDARWWSMDEILQMEGNDLVGSPGFIRRMKRTELLYQKGILTGDEDIKI